MKGYLRRQWPWWLFNTMMIGLSGLLLAIALWPPTDFASLMCAFFAGSMLGCAVSGLMTEFQIRIAVWRAKRDFDLHIENVQAAATDAIFEGLKRGVMRATAEGYIDPGYEVVKVDEPTTKH